MAEPLRGLKPVAETNEDGVSALSASSSRRTNVSSAKDYTPASMFRRSGYQRMPSDGLQEMANLSKDGVEAEPSSSSSRHEGGVSPDGVSGLGIMQSAMRRYGSVKRTPPDTPRSQHGLLESSETSSPALTPGLSRGPGSARSSNLRAKDSWDEMGAALGGGTYRSPSHDSDNRNLLDTPGAGSSAQATPGLMNPRGEISDEDEDFDDALFNKGFSQPPNYCGSKKDIHASRGNWLSITIFILSIYSTVMSGIWLVVAILQPRWGYGISSRQGLNPSTATTLSALISKTIEMSFVTVFISCLGQILTRRAFLRKAQGMTLGEMTMRNWVIQPGSLITHAESVPHAGMTLLGMLALTATAAAAFFTTASDAMVAPKLKYGSWEHRELIGHYKSQYANAQYVGETCPSLLEKEDEEHASESCRNIQFSGQSYRNLINFMSTWTAFSENGSSSARTDLSHRPAGTTLLYDNTTMEATWIETHASDVKSNSDRHKRIVNNITMAMPHPGVYAAATNKENNILQPDDLAGVGEYSIRAGVVAPSINVMCVQMDKEELEPLVYTEWPDSKTNDTGVGDQKIGFEGWEEDVPRYTESDDDDEFLNRTDVDDIFRWGPDFDRRPPVFQLYPADYNLVTNSSVYASNSIYMMSKIAEKDIYTLCELKSWLSPNCSTHFDISGTAGATMKAHCEDDDDEDSYLRSFPPGSSWSKPEMNWKFLAEAWRLSMDLNGGTYNNNASNARILSQLALTEDDGLPKDLPSLAEALAVYASSTLIVGSIDTPFRHYWDLDNADVQDPAISQSFNASMRTQQYTSGHVADWQSIFYIILVLVFAINLFCLVYFIIRSGLVTDFTEPQNLFALAVNSPPSVQLKGSCGGGPEKRDLQVPWRVAYAPSANHYFFEEANERPWKGKYAQEGVSTAREYKQATGTSYKRLSSANSWI